MAGVGDCSSGGNLPHATIRVGPGYQTAFAEQIRRQANILTASVGMITSPVQAEHVLVSGQADAVVVAREFLRDPYWPLRVARDLKQSVSWPVQYLSSQSGGRIVERVRRSVRARPLQVRIRAVLVEPASRAR